MVRGLITRQKYQYILKELYKLPQELNNLINFTNDKLSI